MDFYPYGLGGQVIGGGLDWTRATAVTMQRFLAAYTLHDSNWIGLFLQPAYESIAIIRWDTFWSKGRVEFPSPTVATWPILLVRFARVYQMHATYPKETSPAGFSWQETIQHAESEVVDEPNRLRLLDWLTLEPREPEASVNIVLGDDLQHTVFYPVIGGRIDLWHGGSTRILCLTATGETIQIPDL